MAGRCYVEEASDHRTRTSSQRSPKSKLATRLKPFGGSPILQLPPRTESVLVAGTRRLLRDGWQKEPPRVSGNQVMVSLHHTMKKCVCACVSTFLSLSLSLSLTCIAVYTLLKILKSHHTPLNSNWPLFFFFFFFFF